MYTKYAMLRDERGMTDYQVIEKTGIPFSTFYDWRRRSQRNEAARMSVDYLAKIAKVFGVSIDCFLA